MNKTILFLALAMMSALSINASAQSVERLSTIISGKLSISGTSNRKAFNDATLKDLCEEGYTLAIFTYSGAQERTVTCGGGRSIHYKSSRWENPTSIVNAVAEEVREGGRALVHCWYGVHASKFAASAALTKLCGFSGSQAAAYFRKGIPAGSLSKSRINELAGILEGLSTSGGVTGGCPSP